MFKNKLANIDEEVTVVCAVVMKKKWDIILFVVGFSTQHHRIVTNYQCLTVNIPHDVMIIPENEKDFKIVSL